MESTLSLLELISFGSQVSMCTWEHINTIMCLWQSPGKLMCMQAPACKHHLSQCVCVEAVELWYACKPQLQTCQCISNVCLQIDLPLYFDKMMNNIKAHCLQHEADLAAHDAVNAFPHTPVTCNLGWDLLCERESCIKKEVDVFWRRRERAALSQGLERLPSFPRTLFLLQYTMDSVFVICVQCRCCSQYS